VTHSTAAHDDSGWRSVRLYGRDRFEPDPALGQSPYPVLDPLRRLAASADGNDEAHFAAGAAKRAANRPAFALDEAIEALGG
jgi:hypothetical protein